MNLNEKIKYMIKYLSKSDCLTLNGSCCFFNDNLTFETYQNGSPTEISIDDDQKDDNFKTIFVKDIYDINIQNNRFVVDCKNETLYIQCLKLQDIKNFN